MVRRVHFIKSAAARMRSTAYPIQFRLVHAAVEVVQEHFLGEGGALAERKQLQHLIFLARQVDALAADFDSLGIEVDDQLAGHDDRLGVALGAADDSVDAGDELVLVERLGHVVVSAETEAANLVFDAGHPRQNKDGRLDLGQPESAKHFISGHVGQVQIEKDDIIIIQLAQIDAFFTEIGGINIKTL